MSSLFIRLNKDPVNAEKFSEISNRNLHACYEKRLFTVECHLLSVDGIHYVSDFKIDSDVSYLDLTIAIWWMSAKKIHLNLLAMPRNSEGFKTHLVDINKHDEIRKQDSFLGFNVVHDPVLNWTEVNELSFSKTGTVTRKLTQEDINKVPFLEMIFSLFEESPKAITAYETAYADGSMPPDIEAETTMIFGQKKALIKQPSVTLN